MGSKAGTCEERMQEINDYIRTRYRSLGFFHREQKPLSLESKQ